MFSSLQNIQHSVAVEIEHLMADNSFPACVLFSGPKFSGRMTCACMVSEALGGTAGNRLIVSDRDFRMRISACAAFLAKKRNNAARKLFAENVSVFLSMFSREINSSGSETNKKKNEAASDCSEKLREIMAVSEEDIPKWTADFAKTLNNLYPPLNSCNLSVEKMRSIRKWCYEYSTEGKNKAVIIEGLEDAGQSVSNALLKILEEPPVNTYFFIIAENPGKIKKTVLSRLRRFVFRPLDGEGTEYVFRSLNIMPDQYENIRMFFVENSGTDYRLIRSCTEELAAGIEPQQVKLADELEKTSAYSFFYEMLTQAIRQRHSQGSVSTSKAEKALLFTENTVSRAKLFNQNPRLTFDCVVYGVLKIINEQVV